MKDVIGAFLRTTNYFSHISTRSLQNSALPHWFLARLILNPFESLRPMVLEYFHSSTLSAHLGLAKTLSRTQKVFYWPDMKSEVCDFVRRCQDCQRAKPAQNSRLGLHSSEVVTRPLERIFIDFFGPIVRSRKGFSKFVCMYPVRRSSSDVVRGCLVERFFPYFGVPQSIVSDNVSVFKLNNEEWGSQQCPRYEPKVQHGSRWG
jgi:hypothetical protein